MAAHKLSTDDAYGVDGNARSMPKLVHVGQVCWNSGGSVGSVWRFR